MKVGGVLSASLTNIYMAFINTGDKRGTGKGTLNTGVETFAGFLQHSFEMNALFPGISLPLGNGRIGPIHSSAWAPLATITEA